MSGPTEANPSLVLVHARRQHERLARRKFLANQREAEDASLEPVGKTRKQWSFLLIFT
jgi:hypothetical protein